MLSEVTHRELRADLVFRWIHDRRSILCLDPFAELAIVDEQRQSRKQAQSSSLFLCFHDHNLGAHVDFATRGVNVLDLAYTNIPGVYHAEPRPHLGYSDHITVMLIPAYRPLVRHSKPVLKLVKTWPEGAISALQDCFECTDWDIFSEAATNGDTTDLEEYTSSVTSYISKCIDDMTISKSITTCSNQKPWMTAKVHALLKSRDSAFRAGDKDALRTARAKLSRAIREAKCTRSQRIHGHFQSSGDTWRMWQGIQSITNYRPASPACDSDASLPDVLNSFYTWFETQNDVTARKTIPTPEDQAEEGSSSTSHPETIESILSSCITAWFGNCIVSDRKTLQRTVNTAEKITGVSLPSITDIYSTRCIRKANNIMDDPTQPSHTLFTLLPSGKRAREQNKRAKLYGLLKQKHIDVVMLQETHSDISNAADWVKEWDGAVERMRFLDTLNNVIADCDTADILILGGDFTTDNLDQNHGEPHVASQQKNGQKRFIHAVRTESGDLLSEPTEIRKQTVSFYSKLYSSEWSGAQVVEDSFLMDLPKISERAARELDRELTLEELHEALQRMENGRASGIDGLPVEFYKAFWAVIGQDMLDVLRNNIRRGIVTLRELVNIMLSDLLRAKDLAVRMGLQSLHVVNQLLHRWRSALTSEKRVQLMDYQHTETGPAEDRPFPQLNIAPDLDGCAGPLLECWGEGEMDFGSVSGKLLYRACVKVLNKKKLSGRVDTPWRSVLGFNDDVKPEWMHCTDHR
ncbi:hypothetical protein QTP86_011610 [Hemibagrus guttatus]|nr:hypothetical protein QTP86_011610 [Hemibagrus guttatus]